MLKHLLLFAFKLSCFGIIPWLKTTKVVMLWFNFILGLIIFIFFCFKLIIIHYHTQKQKKIKFKPKIKLNHNSYIDILLYDNLVFSPKFPYLFWQIPDENSSDVYLELPSTTRWLSFSDNDDIERCKWFLLKSCVCVLCDNIKTSWSHIMGLLALRILRSQKNFQLFLGYSIIFLLITIQFEAEVSVLIHWLFLYQCLWSLRRRSWREIWWDHCFCKYIIMSFAQCFLIYSLWMAKPYLFLRKLFSKLNHIFSHKKANKQIKQVSISNSFSTCSYFLL